MKRVIKNLWLVVVLILAASLLLLLSDLGQRESNRISHPEEFPSIAIMQFSSTPLLDRHVAGILERLETEGMVAPGHKNLRVFNPQGDLNTANAIAKEIINGSFDLAITSSTTALQTLARANQQVGKVHIFGAVTDPYGAGVGITGPEPSQHPLYMAGISTFQPVASSFRILRELNGKINRIGVVWNPGEQCSQACVKEAKQICRELGIELVAAIATNTSEVAKAVQSLLTKGVEAIYIGGDTVANASIGMIISLSNKAKIPVFTNDPTDVSKGALFGLGADYKTVGQYTADIAIAILRGRSPASFRIENVVPEVLNVNKKLLAGLGSAWKMSSSVLQKMQDQRTSGGKKQAVLDFKVLLKKGIQPTHEMIKNADVLLNIPRKGNRPATIAMITLVENLLLEEAQLGVEEGLKQSGLKDGHDYRIRKYSAQGEIGQLPQIIDAAIRDKPDLIVTVTTPAMAAVVNRVKDIPVIFTVASDPFKIKLFKKERADNVCGVHDNPAMDVLIEMAIRHNPRLRKVGIVYDASQVNSMLSVERLRTVCQKRAIGLLEATASSITELGMATHSVIQRGAGAIIISADNLAITGFSAIYKASRPANIPIFATEPRLVDEGAAGAYGDNYFEWGKQAGRLAAKAIAGVPPRYLPITDTEVKVRRDPLDHQAGRKSEKMLRIRLVHYSDTEFAERCHKGLLDGLRKAGYQEGKQYTLRVFNAQGDMSTLSSIMTTIKAERPDLLMVISTPTLQAAIRQIGSDTRIVFTGVGDAVKAGAGKSEKQHLPNITGITTRSPFSDMARLISESVPGVRSVGTLYTPAEINSVLYMEWFRDALKQYGLELVTVPVTSSADVAQAATEMCRKKIQVVCQIVDNLTRPGFALIADKARQSQLPVFVFDSDQMRDGGNVCLSRDYYDAGLEAAEKAVRILQGENPAKIPFSNTRSMKKIYHPEMVKQLRIKLPQWFLSHAETYSPKM